MDKKQEYYIQIEKLLRDALAKLGVDLADKEFKIVSEFLDHNELGLAFEMLVDILSEHALKPNSEAYALIEDAGKRMGYDNSDNSGRWEAFKKLATR